MVLLARLDKAWRNALHLVEPDTLLRWHRDLFKLIWRRKSRFRGAQPRRLSKDTIELIVSMARDNGCIALDDAQAQQIQLVRETVRHLTSKKQLVGCSWPFMRDPSDAEQM
jgi:putative transposase